MTGTIQYCFHSAKRLFIILVRQLSVIKWVCVHGTGINVQCDAMRWEQVLRPEMSSWTALTWIIVMKTAFKTKKYASKSFGIFIMEI